MALDIPALKTQLETELAALNHELQTLGTHNPNVPGAWIPTPGTASTSQADDNVVADRSEDLSERQGTLDALAVRYKNLERALTKIADGTYGICEISNGEIEADRLAANPAARTCKAHINDEASLTD